MLYHKLKINRLMSIEQVKDHLQENLPSDWCIENAVLPGRDFVVRASALSGVFISVKPTKKPNQSFTQLNFNVATPSVLLRSFGLISLFTSKAVVEYVFESFKNEKV